MICAKTKGCDSLNHLHGPQTKEVIICISHAPLFISSAVWPQLSCSGKSLMDPVMLNGNVLALAPLAEPLPVKFNISMTNIRQVYNYCHGQKVTRLTKC